MQSYDSSIQSLYLSCQNYFNDETNLYNNILQLKKGETIQLDDELNEIYSLLEYSNQALDKECSYTIQDYQLNLINDTSLQLDSHFINAYFINACQQNIDLSSLYGVIISLNNNRYLLKPFYNGYYPIVLKEDGMEYLQLNLINSQSIITIDSQDDDISHLTIITQKPYVAAMLATYGPDLTYDQFILLSDQLSEQYKVDVNYIASFKSNKDIYNIKLESNQHYFTWSDDLDMQVMPII